MRDNQVVSDLSDPAIAFVIRARAERACASATTRWASLAHRRCRAASIWRSGRCEPSVRTRRSGRGRIVRFDRPEEDVMESVGLLDRAGRRRSQATLSRFHQGRVPRNKGLRYPPDPPPVEEIIAVMRAAGDGPEAMRLRGLIIVLWRAGLRISEALALAETDLDRHRGAVLVRAGKGGRRREVGMDAGRGSSLTRGLSCAGPCRSARSSAFCAGRPAVGHARRPGSVPSCIAPRWPPESGVGSHPTNSATPTLSRCPAKGSRSWSYSANSGMPTSGSPPRTCAGSTTPRSSTRSTSGQHP